MANEFIIRKGFKSLANSEITGSLVVSGSTIHEGYIRLNPVASNIDTSISASYIYVSGSTNDLYFSQNGAGYANTTRLRWLEGNLYTGLLNGGLITTQSSTVYQIASGSGVVVNLNASLNNNPYPIVTYVNWNNLSASIDLTGSYDQSFVAVLSNGTIGAQGTPYNDGDFNTKIPIGIVIHQNRSTINAVQTFPSVGYGWKQRSNDFIRAFGPLKISGYTLTPSGSSTGSLVLSGGVAWVDGRNYIVDPSNPSYIDEASGIVTSKVYRYRQSGSGWAYDTNGGAGYATIDPANYSLNGTLTPVGSNDWTVQRVYYFPNSATKAFYIYYGNATYSTQANALAAINTETFTEAPNTAANAILVGYLILRNNADFTTPASYTIQAAGLFRGSGASSGGGGGSGATALSGLTDTSITSPTNAQPLAYNSVTTKWENRSQISASLKGNADTATTASFASTASYVNTLNQNVIITGSVVIGSGSLGASENTLTLGARDSSGEGGQLGFNAPGGTYTSASFIDLYQNRLRILKGTNDNSTGEVANWSMHSLQMSLPAYTNVSAFPGTAAALLAVDSGGNVLTVATGSGGGGSGTVTNIATAGSVNGITLTGGPISTTGTITLGGTLSGIQSSQLATSSLMIGSTNIALGATGSSLTGLTSVTATSFTGSLQGTSSWAQNAVTASFITTAQTASYVLQAVSASYATTSSFAVSASYVPTTPTFPYTGSASISGSLNVNGLISSSYVSASTISIGGAPHLNTTATLYSNGTSTYGLYIKNGAGVERFSVDDAGLVNFNGASGNVYINPNSGLFTYEVSAKGGFGLSRINFQNLMDLYSNDGTLGLRVNDTYTAITDQTKIGGTTAPISSAILELVSTGSGFLLPRMTTTERNTISSPATGLMVYDTTLSSSYQYNGSSWNAVNGTTTGSFTGSFIGSLVGTSSWANNAVTASYFSGSISNVDFATSASYALTASYAMNGGGSSTPTFPYTGSAIVTGSLVVTGSTISTAGFTGSLLGTSSWANNAVTASFITTAQTASYVLNAVSASFASTASLAPNYTTLISFNDFTSSYNSGSFTGSFTGSLLGTASWANNVISASYSATASIATSSSYALTASYAMNGGGASFPYTGSAIISGSLIVTGSLEVTAGITGSLLGTASFATSASYAATASLAPSYLPLTGGTITGNIIITSGSGFIGLSAGENLAAGDFVNIYSGGVRKASNNDTTKQAHGFVLNTVTTGTAVTVYYSGLNIAGSGLTAGARYFLGTAGAETTTPPTSAGQLSQEIGVAISTTTISVNFGPAIIT